MSKLELILPRAKARGAQEILKIADRIEPVLPSQVNFRQFLANAIVAANDPVVADCTSTSIVVAVFNSARIGLNLGNIQGHAYLVPFRNKHKGGQKEAQLIPGFKGYLDLAFRNHFLKAVSTELLLNGEEASRSHDERGPHFRHAIPERDRLPANRSTIEAAYCTYETRLGAFRFEWVTREEINKVDTNRNVWQSDYAAQCRKTAIRRAAKLWQLTPEMAAAVELDTQADMGRTQSGAELIDRDDRPTQFSLKDLPDPETPPPDASVGENDGQPDQSDPQPQDATGGESGPFEANEPTGSTESPPFEGESEPTDAEKAEIEAAEAKISPQESGKVTPQNLF